MGPWMRSKFDTLLLLALFGYLLYRGAQEKAMKHSAHFSSR